jgi:hypothetical protein
LTRNLILTELVSFRQNFRSDDLFRLEPVASNIPSFIPLQYSIDRVHKNDYDQCCDRYVFPSFPLSQFASIFMREHKVRHLKCEKHVIENCER